MTVAPINLITLDERGIACVAGSRIKVAHLAVEARDYGYSPLNIQQAHEHLTLAEIHAALSY